MVYDELISLQKKKKGKSYCNFIRHKFYEVSLFDRVLNSNSIFLATFFLAYSFLPTDQGLDMIDYFAAVFCNVRQLFGLAWKPELSSFSFEPSNLWFFCEID